MQRALNAARSRFAGLQRELRQRAQLATINRYNLLLIAEGQGWILDDFSQQVLLNLPQDQWRGRVLDFMPEGLQGRVMHFVERYRFFRHPDPASICHNNRVIVIWWHGGASSVEHVHLDELMGRIPELAALPITFHITSSLYTPILQNAGVPEDKIIYAPMGVDRSRFAMRGTRASYKAQVGVPEDKFCIGYFQRDGDVEPKLVKGPDVFVQVIERLWSQRDDLFVLLAGPKRGYVISQLKRLGVPYAYAGWVPFAEMAPYYFASDLYMITSREEGGPAAVLECMATGTPLISTRVGMAVDVIEQGKNGFLADIEDTQAITEYALCLMNDQVLRRQIAENALITAQSYDWKVIAPQYVQRLYAPAKNGL